jgi:rhodanese-related sulfurtransferase
MKAKGIQVFILVLTFTTILSSAWGQQIKKLTSVEFMDQYSFVFEPANTIPIIDGRTEQMFKDEHIANAINIDADAENMPELIRKYSSEPKVILYCTTKRRTTDIITEMEKFYTGEIIAIIDGIRGWKENGFPTIKKTECTENN